MCTDLCFFPFVDISWGQGEFAWEISEPLEAPDNTCYQSSFILCRCRFHSCNMGVTAVFLLLLNVLKSGLMDEWIDQILLSVICIQKTEAKDLLAEQCAMTYGSSGLFCGT